MKRIIQSLCFIIAVFAMMAHVSAQQISYTHNRDNSGLSVKFSMPSYSFKSIDYKNEDMKEIVVSGITMPNDEGYPNIPTFSRYIVVPEGADVKVSISDNRTSVEENVNLAPALRIQAENEEPETEYKKNEKIYSTNANYPENPILVSKRMSLRGVDVVILSITPFQYNPVTQTLTAYNDINIDVDFVGGTKSSYQNKYRSPWFDPILRNVLLNYEDLPQVDYAQRSKERYNAKDELTGCEYLIVIPNREDFRPMAQQIRDYRTKQGILTKVMSLSEMGCTSTQMINTFFEDAYENWDIPPVAVLLMGDHSTNMAQGIPASTVTHPDAGSCISDNPYADVDGDLLPDIVFARMSAENASQLNVLVSKMFEYEQTPCMDTAYYNHPITALGWQTERWFQICSEVIGGYFRLHGKNPVRINAIYDGNPGSTWSTADNTSDVVNYFGPNGLNYIPQTPSSLGGWSGGNAAMVVNAVNNGACILQHRDHGYEDGWGEPDFTSSNINQLQNVGKMTFLFTINCLTGKFNHYSPCFGEVFQRHTYNGQNAGCVGFVAPTEVSYSFVNDTYAWGMYDLFDPAFMPNYGPYADNSGNWLPAFGNVAGKYFLAQSSWPYNYTEKEITYQMFTSHADAFMRIYTEQPQQLAVEHTPTAMAGMAPFIITCTQGATIAVTHHGEILVVTTATGTEQEIELPFVLPDDTLTLVCTKQNYLRYETPIVTIPAEGAYIVGRGWNINDDNDDDLVNFSETFTIDYSIKNVGVDVAENVTAVISSDDPYVTFVDNTASLGNVITDSVLTYNDIFTIKASPVIPDEHVVNCVITFTSDTSSWTAKFEFTANAPNIVLESNGVEGQLLPGETLNLTATFVNNGHADIHNATGVYTTDNPYVTINTTEPVALGDIPADSGRASAAFSITVSPDAPFGTVINSTVTISADNDFTCEGHWEPFIDICNVAVSDYPYLEDFEDEKIPDCWTQEVVAGEAMWTLADGGQNGHPQHAHSGSNNAFIYAEDATVKLVSPLLNLANVENAQLTFWHAQSVSQGNQDKLRIYYKNATDGQWVMLKEYLYSNASWKERTIDLPNVTANYYVAFEAECNGGWGVVLDDVQITGDVAVSQIAGDANTDGTVDILDIQVVVEHMFMHNPQPFSMQNADVDNNGIININDIIKIASIIYAN